MKHLTSEQYKRANQLRARQEETVTFEVIILGTAFRVRAKRSQGPQLRHLALTEALCAVRVKELFPGEVKPDDQPRTIEQYHAEVSAMLKD